MKKSYKCLISYSFSIIALAQMFREKNLIATIFCIIGFITLPKMNSKDNKINYILGIFLSLIVFITSYILEIKLNPLLTTLQIFYYLILLNKIKSLKHQKYLYCLKMILISLIILFSLLLFISIISWIILKVKTDVISYTLISLLIFTPLFFSFIPLLFNIKQKILN